VLGIERRNIRIQAPPQVVVKTLRSRIRRAREDIPGVWLGQEVSTGVVGWVFARFLFLQPVPPGCTLFNGSVWRVPVVVGRVVPACQRGSELRMRVIPQGIPFSVPQDPAALALLDAWQGALVAELETPYEEFRK
jgi:hypothetical protein